MYDRGMYVWIYKREIINFHNLNMHRLESYSVLHFQYLCLCITLEFRATFIPQKQHPSDLIVISGECQKTNIKNIFRRKIF